VLELETYYDGARARDDRVRAAALVALKPFAPRWSNSILLIRRALNDSSTLVQAKALELLGAEHIDELRAYQVRTRHADLRKIADDLIGTAEERGAPLVPDSAGRIMRTSLAGPTLVFAPTKRWPNWDMALGQLTVSLPGQTAVRISDSVEVVRNVVPAFVSADGQYLVYEAGRRIHVRNLGSGADRVVARGSAPRLVPFTESFVYLQEQGPDKPRKQNAIGYDVVMAPLAGGSSTVLGSVSMPVAHEQHGRASPARWMSVREVQGKFQLVGAGFEPFALPDPFAATAK
jgi:hypothetical protein